MSTNLKEDLDYAKVVLDKKYDYNHWHIFGNTNEMLDDIFDSIDISDKSVLTIMSSSDYLIMSHLFGAKNVECFDINPLTYRFFFLRKWLIQNGVLEYGNCEYEELIEIINSVSSFSSEYERECNIFWKEIIKQFNFVNWRCNNLIRSSSTSLLYYFYAKKRDVIEQIFPSLNPVFYNVNLSEKSGLGIEKKYDYVFISNIFDVHNNRDSERLETIKRNLLNILGPNGRVVCTHFPAIFGGRDKTPDILKPERKVFDKDFDFHMLDDIEIVEGNMAYVYTRKN